MAPTEKPIIVAVTGFAPYKKYEHNTSAMIRDALPTQILRPDKRPIIILRYPHDIRCVYSSVIPLIPKLWNGEKSIYQPDSPSGEQIEIDVMLHIGMAPRSHDYRVEKHARRDGYKQPDMDGEHIDPDALKDLPEELSPDFDVEDVVVGVGKQLPGGVNCRTSDDAGLYFCELTLFLSLTELQKKGKFKAVDFLHVPLNKEKEAIANGVMVAEALILELVDRLPS